MQVNYSVNGGPYLSLVFPFYVDTFGWDDGEYTITIKALDQAGNQNTTSFFFTIDSTKPKIILETPQNNSIIRNGILLNFSIIDINLMEANYSVNGGNTITFFTPFDISTTGWEDGDYTVQINAQDLANNSNSSWFFFTIDSTIPSIELKTPNNNSIIKAGTILDFFANEPNIMEVNYSINGGLFIIFTEPYDLNTSTWTDGDYTILINVKDQAGNTNTSWFSFTIDSTKPTIILISPQNQSILVDGIPIDLSIDDPYLLHVNYTINGGSTFDLSDPFNLSTSGWDDGEYTIQINAIDIAGNSNSSVFLFTIDNKPPEINLSAPFNNSVIKDGTVLNFYIADPNLLQVNYSINTGSESTLIDPYNISTLGWTDGIYNLRINAVDSAGNSNFSIYLFIIDSTLPEIILNSPSNNEIFKNGSMLDFNIIDVNLKEVNYSINGGSNITISEPYNISTLDWKDGNYTIQINGVDLAGNSYSSTFHFILDSTKPEITLGNPGNNSINKKGIILNFTIVDPNLSLANYSINGGSNISFSDPYDIITFDWQDGNYLIQINTIDKAGNTNSSWYTFTIDSTSPMIELISPQNNTAIKPGTPLNIRIIEPHLSYTSYFMNGSGIVLFSSNFNISTTGWQDDNYTIHIGAYDLAENSNYLQLFFIIDSTPPELVLDPTLNHSTIPIGEILELEIIGDDLDTIVISLADGIFTSLSSPYEIDTSDWTDGLHKVTIFANDTTGNNMTYWFEVTVDAVLPTILYTDPEIGMEGVAPNSSITITFSEPMNKSDIGNYLVISPHEDLISQWNQDGTALTISSASDVFMEDTYYELTLSHQISDVNGNQMDSDYQLTFTTKPQTVPPDPPGAESEFPFLILGLVA
jgi:hypothetical protein